MVDNTRRGVIRFLPMDAVIDNFSKCSASTCRNSPALDSDLCDSCRFQWDWLRLVIPDTRPVRPLPVKVLFLVILLTGTMWMARGCFQNQPEPAVSSLSQIG